MSDYNGLLTKDIPAAYRLSVSLNPLTLHFLIHEDVILLSKGRFLNTSSPIVESLYEEYEFKSFQGILGGDCYGFNSAFKKTAKKNGFVRYSAIISQETVKAIVASLKVLITVGNLFLGSSRKSSSKDPQLLSIESVCTEKTDDPYDGYSLTGTWSKAAAVFLREVPVNTSLPDIEEVIGIAWGLIKQEKPDPGLHYAILMPNGGLAIDVAGHAGIQPSHGENISGDTGYAFGCHNVEHAKLQICLYCGIAKFCDLYHASKTLDNSLTKF